MSDHSLVKSRYLILGFWLVFLGNLRKLKIQVTTLSAPKVWLWILGNSFENEEAIAFAEKHLK